MATDARSEASDAPPGALDAPSSIADVDGATSDRSDDLDAEVRSDALDGQVHSDVRYHPDSQCECVDFRADAGFSPTPLTVRTSLECFGSPGPPYDFIIRNPCIGLEIIPGYPFGRRIRNLYAAENVVSIFAVGAEGGTSETFYDATTLAIVGARRWYSWDAWDPIFCDQRPDPFTRGNVQVEAGVTPAHPADSSTVICGPREAGLPDADALDPDGWADDATSSDAHLADTMDETSRDSSQTDVQGDPLPSDAAGDAESDR